MAKKQKKNVTISPSPREIELLAYHMYLKEGCPPGRDTDHWLEAEMMLKAESEKKARDSQQQS